MKLHRKPHRWPILGLVLILAASLLAACNRGNNSDNAAPRTLRIGVMYGNSSDEYYTRQQLTDAYELKQQGAINIEIVSAVNSDQWMYTNPEEQNQQPDVYEEVKKLLTGPNPVDVMVLDSSLLTLLARDNLLVQLDPLIAEDEIDTNEFVPAVIDGIKEMGDGFIYAMTPTFNSSALFYNKKLFQERGVEFPRDNMTWDDLFNLARRLKQGEGKDATWGFTFNEWGGGGGGLWEMEQYIQPLNLRMYDEKAEKMTVNNDSWKNAWETFVKLYKDKVLPKGEDLVMDPPKDGRWFPYMDRPFFRGKVAMVIGSYNFVNELVNFNNNVDRIKDQGFERIDWDVVTLPSHSSAPGVSSGIYLNQLLTINANAQNKEDAWEYIKFMIGEEWARLKSRSSWELSARKAFVQPREGLDFHIEAFYMMKPVPPRPYAEQMLEREKPNLWMIRQIGDMLYNRVLQDQMTVEEALAEWERRGNEALQKIKENPNGPIEGVMEDLYQSMMK